jgi:hypothetical protein
MKSHHLAIACVLTAMLMIFTLGCSRSTSASLPKDAPLIGTPFLGLMEDKGHFLFVIPICNREAEKFEAQVYVESGMSELISPVPTLYKRNSKLARIEVGTGTYSEAAICEIRKKRSQPIRLKLTWKVGTQTGVKRLTITPQQENTTLN